MISQMSGWSSWHINDTGWYWLFKSHCFFYNIEHTLPPTPSKPLLLLLEFEHHIQPASRSPPPTQDSYVPWSKDGIWFMVIHPILGILTIQQAYYWLPSPSMRYIQLFAMAHMMKRKHENNHMRKYHQISTCLPRQSWTSRGCVLSSLACWCPTPVFGGLLLAQCHKEPAARATSCQDHPFQSLGH